MFGAGDDDAGGGGGGGFGDKGEEGVDAVDYAEEVDGHYGVEVGGVRPGAFEPDAGVKDEEVDFTWSMLGVVGKWEGMGRVCRCSCLLVWPI